MQSGQAVAYLLSSILFGLAWQTWGPEIASRMAAGGVLIALVATAVLLGVGRTDHNRTEETS